MLPKMPKFETEAEEAEWWYEQRHNIAAEFARVKPKLGPSSAVRFLAKARGISVEEMQSILRANSSATKPSAPSLKLPKTA
jgi:hypothetical protein